MKRLLLCMLALPLTACNPAGEWEKAVNVMMGLVVPEQHEQFSRTYFEQVIAGDFAAAQAMVETRAWCFIDFRGAGDTLAATKAAHDPECSSDPASLRPILAMLPSSPASDVHTSNYHANENKDRLQVRIEQEFVYDTVVVRAAMEYVRDGNVRRVEHVTLTLDNMTLMERVSGVANDVFGGKLWLLFGLQVVAYLAVPLIVLWILRRQRNSRRRNNDGRFEA